MFIENLKKSFAKPGNYQPFKAYLHAAGTA
jgi:hypothetical protein